MASSLPLYQLHGWETCLIVDTCGLEGQQEINECLDVSQLIVRIKKKCLINLWPLQLLCLFLVPWKEETATKILRYDKYDCWHNCCKIMYPNQCLMTKIWDTDRSVAILAIFKIIYLRYTNIFNEDHSTSMTSRSTPVLSRVCPSKVFTDWMDSSPNSESE